jgi:tetratricopeptide (TPR) repeat protein
VEAERRGDYAGAVPLFLQLIHDGADSAALRTNLGIAYFQLKEFDKALHQFRASLGTAPKSVQANLFAGLSLLNLQRPKEALSFLKTAHLADPHDGVVVLAFARAEVASNDLAAARTFYEKATRLDAQNAEAWYGLGITERILAERELKVSLRSGERDAKAEGARTLLEASGKAVARAMQLDPGSVRGRIVLGESFRIAERYDLAVQEYTAAVEQQPNLAVAWAGLAAAYSASGNDPSALKASERALALEPNDAETEALVAGIYSRSGDYVKAEAFAARALELRPGFAGAQVALAKIYLAQQQPEKALPELQAAVKDDTDGTTYYLLASTLKRLGKSSEAAVAMRQYKQLHDQHVSAISVSR